MENIEKINISLLKSTYFDQDMNEYTRLWNEINYDKSILNQATELKKEKDGTFTVRYPIIAEAMLINYDDVDKECYNKLIDLVFSNLSVARTFVAGKEKNMVSFLVMSLWNKDLKLTSDQKAFAVTEALKRIQELRIQNSQEAKELNIDKSKTALVHGTDPHDIRYYILKNPNWTQFEKEDLAEKFWEDIAEFKSYIETLENRIIQQLSSKETRITNQMLQDVIYAYDYYDLLEIVQDEVLTGEIFEEIKFCQEMHEIAKIREIKSNIWWKI